MSKLGPVTAEKNSSTIGPRAGITPIRIFDARAIL